MKAARRMTAAMLIAASGWALDAAGAQEGIKRTDLQRHDLSAPGREVIQTRVDLAPGAAFPRHKPPSEEIIYILEGVIEYQLEGKPPVTLNTGNVLFIPAETIHAAKNVGSVSAGQAWHLRRRERQAADYADEVSIRRCARVFYRCSNRALAHRVQDEAYVQFKGTSQKVNSITLSKQNSSTTFPAEESS